MFLHMVPRHSSSTVQNSKRRGKFQCIISHVGCCEIICLFVFNFILKESDWVTSSLPRHPRFAVPNWWLLQNRSENYPKHVEIGSRLQHSKLYVNYFVLIVHRLNHFWIIFRYDRSDEIACNKRGISHHKCLRQLVHFVWIEKTPTVKHRNA